MKFCLVTYYSTRQLNTFTMRVAYGHVQACLADVASVGGILLSCHAEV